MIEMRSIKDTSAKYGLSAYILRLWLLSGKIKGVRIGRGKMLINCGDLERFLSESYVNAPESDETESGIKPVSF